MQPTTPRTLKRPRRKRSSESEHALNQKSFVEVDELEQAQRRNALLESQLSETSQQLIDARLGSSRSKDATKSSRRQIEISHAHETELQESLNLLKSAVSEVLEQARYAI